jgi:hypothetical protein
MTLRKLQTALGIYAALALAGAFLARGDIRVQALLWILLAGLALKSWAAYKLHQ